MVCNNQGDLMSEKIKEILSEINIIYLKNLLEHKDIDFIIRNLDKLPPKLRTILEEFDLEEIIKEK